MADTRKNIVLKVIAGPGEGTRLNLTAGRHIVGSGAGCAIRIEHESVAALHAMLVVGNDVLRIYPVQRSVQLHVGSACEIVEVNGSDLAFNQNIDIGEAILMVADSADETVTHTLTEDNTLANPDLRHTADELAGGDILDDFRVGIESVVDAPSLSASEKLSSEVTAAPDHAARTIHAKEKERINSAMVSTPSQESLGVYSRASNQRDRAEENDIFRSPAPRLTDSNHKAKSGQKPLLRRPPVSQTGSSAKQQRQTGSARRSVHDASAAGSLAAAARRTLSSISNASPGTGRASRPSSSRALVTVAQPQHKANEVFALVVSGAVDVSDNVSRGFWSFWREGFRSSRPALIGVLLASIVGLLFIADRQTVAVYDDTVSPSGSVSAGLVSAGLTELSVTEGSDNRITLSGFVKDDKEKRVLDQILSGFEPASFSQVNVTVATELLVNISEVLNQYDMDRLRLTYVGPGHVKIDGYVGPAQDWDEAVTTLKRDFKSLSEVDDRGVETLAERLADLKFMLLDVDLGQLAVEPRESSIAVTGSLPTLKISDWVGVMGQFQTKYNSNPEIINKVLQEKPQPMPAVPIAGTMQLNGKKYITVEPSGSRYDEGDYMPDGTQVRRIEKDRVVFFRNGYEYPQAHNSGFLFLSSDNSKVVELVSNSTDEATSTRHKSDDSLDSIPVAAAAGVKEKD